MLFFVQAALAAVVLGWPCQRLNWAWRNVWVTCSINAFAPGSGVVGTLPGGFVSSTTSAAPIGFQLDNVGQFQPGPTTTGATNAGPYLCTSGPNTGGSFFRNRCRRMLDTYGNLVNLCHAPYAVPHGNIGPNTLTPDYLPQPGHQPHYVNVQNLGFMAQECLTPGATFPTVPTTCPGLAGWFTVVWNACQFTNAPGVGGTPPTAPGINSIPNFLGGPAYNTPNEQFLNPSYLCGGLNPAAPLGPGVWNSGHSIPSPAPSGLAYPFRTSRCRKSLDQFGRTASRCNPQVTPNSPLAPAMGNGDPTRYLASNLGLMAPNCNA